jgi:hypothetical protein
MGKTKVFLHPSPLESCSLVIFEALNAGAYPIVRKAGACEEQLGKEGFVYTNFAEAEKKINEIISQGYSIENVMKQGQKFDRMNVKRKIKELLKRLE